MEIRAKNDVTIKKIKLLKEYKTLCITYAVCTGISLLAFLLIEHSVNFLILFIISFLGGVFMYLNGSNLKNVIYELDDCFIRLSATYLEFKQLVNGEYQIGKIYIPEITNVMKVKEGVQIWYDTATENSRYMIDDDIVKADTICINFYAYDKEEFIDFYLLFIDSLSDKAVKELDTVEWKEEHDVKDWIKMMSPCILYLVPLLLNISS